MAKWEIFTRRQEERDERVYAVYRTLILCAHSQYIYIYNFLIVNSTVFGTVDFTFISQNGPGEMEMKKPSWRSRFSQTTIKGEKIMLLSLSHSLLILLTDFYCFSFRLVVKHRLSEKGVEGQQNNNMWQTKIRIFVFKLYGNIISFFLFRWNSKCELVPIDWLFTWHTVCWQCVGVFILFLVDGGCFRKIPILTVVHNLFI